MHQVRTLEGEMRHVLVSMTLLQYGRTQALASSSGDTERDPRPAGEQHPLAEKWLAEWLRDPTEDTLLMARAELDAWKRSVPRDEDHEWDEDAWILEDGRGMTPADASVRFKRTASYVRNLRQAKGLSTETGFKKAEDAPLVSDAVRIVNLAAQGCTERQIAFQVGVGKSTVRRALGRAA